MVFWTENRIERSVENSMNRIDKEFMEGGLSHAEYDLCVDELCRWAREKYAELARAAMLEKA